MTDDNVGQGIGQQSGNTVCTTVHRKAPICFAMQCDRHLVHDLACLSLAIICRHSRFLPNLTFSRSLSYKRVLQDRPSPNLIHDVEFLGCIIRLVVEVDVEFLNINLGERVNPRPQLL